MATTKVRYNQIKTGLPAGGDVNYNDVSLLLLMNGANGSTVFTDSSNSDLSNSFLGVNISTAESKFGGSSAYFDGNGDYLAVASSSGLAFDTADFTFEGWANITTHLNAPKMFTNWNGNPFSINHWSLHIDHPTNSEKVSFWFYNHSGSSPLLVSTSSISTNTWYHIAVTRSGNTFRLFVNGIEEASATSSASIDGGGSFPVEIGGDSIVTDRYLHGYLDGLRITKNVARYTSNFSVPTAAFPAFESKEGKELRVGANGTIELES